MPSNPLLLPPPRSPRGDNAFALLGVSPDATPGEVKRAYLYLARKYHPDVNHSAEAGELFLRINQTYVDIMSRRNLTELMLKCPVVKAKGEYAEGLQIFKRAKIMAGIDPQVAGGAATGELGKQLQTLGMYLFFVCPGCQWREKCDHATRFDEVEEIHRELMSKTMNKSMENLSKAMDTLSTLFGGGKDEKKRAKRSCKRKKEA